MYIDFTMNNTEVFSITDSKQDECIIGDSRLACGVENTGLSLYTWPRIHVKSIRTPTPNVAHSWTWTMYENIESQSTKLPTVETKRPVPSGRHWSTSENWLGELAYNNARCGVTKAGKNAMWEAREKSRYISTLAMHLDLGEIVPSDQWNFASICISTRNQPIGELSRSYIPQFTVY